MEVEMYERANPLQPGDFGIKPGGGWPMWIVRLGTFSRYGHAALITEIGTDPGPGRPLSVMIVEARPGDGVIERWTTEAEFRWSANLIEDGEGDEGITRRTIVHFARSCIGHGYDWPSIAGFLVRFFGAKFGYSPEHPDDRVMCSELVVWSYRAAGIDLFPGKAPGDIAPGDLTDFCPRSPGGKP